MISRTNPDWLNSQRVDVVENRGVTAQAANVPLGSSTAWSGRPEAEGSGTFLKPFLQARRKLHKRLRALLFQSSILPISLPSNTPACSPGQWLFHPPCNVGAQPHPCQKPPALRLVTSPNQGLTRSRTRLLSAAWNWCFLYVKSRSSKFIFSL